MKEAENVRGYQKLRIHVHASLKPDGSVGYEVDQDQSDAHHRVKGGRIEIEYREKFEMIFQLKDATGLHLKFVGDADGSNTQPSDTNGVFWVHTGPGCPQSRGDTKSFVVNEVKDHQVTVINHNKTQATYNYRLALAAPDGTPHPFDPVIQNGGGGGGGASINSALLMFLGLLGLGCVAGVAYYLGAFD